MTTLEVLIAARALIAEFPERERQGFAFLNAARGEPWGFELAEWWARVRYVCGTFGTDPLKYLDAAIIAAARAEEPQ